MAKILTSASVERFKATAARREIPDGGARGLFLIVQPSGSKSWAMRFRRPDGKTAKLKLGDVDLSGKEAGYPVMGAPLTLAGARELTAKIQRERKAGADVIADHKAEKRRQKTEAAGAAKNSYGSLLRQFISERARPKLRRWRDVARLLGLIYPKSGDGEPKVVAGGLAQRWADKPVRSIDGHDIFAVMDEARRRGIPGLEKRTDGPSDSSARAVLAALSSLFGWLWKNRLVDANPCASVHRPDAAMARDRVLRESEVIAFWRAADTEDEPFGQLLKLLLLTGCRLNEVAGMTRRELSEDGATWEIPGNRTKNKQAHIVPLSPLARDILATVRPIAGQTSLVFTTTGRTPVSGWSKLKGRLDAAIKIEPWRLHDLRRSAATGMAELGIEPHIVEAALNHISGAKAGVAGTYNRALYAEQKRVALERWAAHIEGLVSGRSANVLTLSGKRTAG
jgi:integrase